MLQFRDHKRFKSGPDAALILKQRRREIILLLECRISGQKSL